MAEKGFVIPIKDLVARKVRPFAQYLLNPHRLQNRDFADFMNFVLPHLEGKADYTNKVWGATMFQLWHFIIEKSN